MGLLFLAILIMAMLQVMGIASILPFMQLATEQEAITENRLLIWCYEYFGFVDSRSMLITMGIGVFILMLIGNIFSVFTTWLQHKYAWELAHNISTRLLRNYLSRPYDYFLKNNTSKLINKTLVEVVQFTTGVLIPLSELAARSLIVLVILVLLMWVDPYLSLVVFGALGLVYLLIFAGTHRFLLSVGEERIDADERLFKSLNEALTGIKTLQVYGAEALFYKRYENASTRLIKIHPSVQLIGIAPRHLIEVLAFGGILGLTLYQLIAGIEVKSLIPLLSLYALAAYRLLPALQKAFSAVTSLRHFMPLIDEIHEDLNLDSLPHLSEAYFEPEPQLAVFEKQITVENISFQYNDDSPILENLNLRIEKGTTVAFAGTTGSGKTTIVDLIVGLLQPFEGCIKIDDMELSRSNVRAWNRQIGYVPQDVFLFDDTISRNIAIGLKDEEIDPVQIEAAARLANIHDFIVKELPGGYQNKIGDRGVRLSGGQRQRLGLARALYRKPKLLILDEATNALDSVTELGVIESLKSAAGSLTVIIIAHRLSTVKHADCIYLLETGQIITKGNYNELLEGSTIFRNMAQLF